MFRERAKRAPLDGRRDVRANQSCQSCGHHCHPLQKLDPFPAVVFRPTRSRASPRRQNWAGAVTPRVPRPCTSIIAQPVKLGDEWYVLARHPSGQRVHVRRFKTQSEAKYWIARKSKAWLKKRGYADD